MDESFKLDSQQVEIIGRNILVSACINDGLEVAEPLRDHGVDLVVYNDRPNEPFKALPIQLKALSKQGFGVFSKYEKFSNMLIAYVWHSNSPVDAELYILTHSQAMAVAEVMGWTRTESWKRGAYTTSSPSKKLVAVLQKYRYTPGSIRSSVVSSL